MDAIRPTSIRADQWNTIADDVKAGRCVAYYGGYRVCDRYAPVFDVDYDVPIQIIHQSAVLTLKWLDNPSGEDAPEWEVNGFATEDEYLFAQSLGARDQEVVALEAENKRLQAELDAANQRAAKYRALLLRTFPIIKDMTIAIAYDDIFGTHVSTGGELP